MCKQFLQNKCGFSAEDCYNTHSKPKEPATFVGNEGFWEVPQNTAPPLSNPTIKKGPTQAEWLQMKQALVHLNKMMEKFQ